MNQYCNSHQDGDMRSVTLRAFFGLVRKRSRGDLRSGTSGSGERGASIERELSLSHRILRSPTTRFGVSQQSFSKASWRGTYNSRRVCCRRGAVSQVRSDMMVAASGLDPADPDDKVPLHLEDLLHA